MKTEKLGELAEKTILLDELIKTSECSVPEYVPLKVNRLFENRRPKIAVANDKAFCFIYYDNIALLRELGCEIEYFSPIEDKKLPEGCCGMILSGGYPELYAEKLSANHDMLNSVKSAIASGMPTVAECGGFMYLHDTLRMSDGTEYVMVGTIQGTAYETQRLQRFGYAAITSDKDNLICKKGQIITTHEFHYWDSTDCGSDFTAEKADGRSWRCVHADMSLYAGFPHLYFYTDTNIAKRYVAACAEFGGIYG